MASCAHCHRVSPSATTSRRRPSKLLNSARSMSRTWRFVETRALLHGTLGQQPPPKEIPFSPTPSPRRTLHDDGQTCQVGGHIGRCAWTEGGEGVNVDTRRRGTAGPPDGLLLTWGAQSKGPTPGSVLRAHQSPGAVAESGPHLLAHELLFQRLGGPLLPSGLRQEHGKAMSTNSSTRDATTKTQQGTALQLTTCD